MSSPTGGNSGVFADEAIRLLREKWKDPNPLAEEMYSIIKSWSTRGVGPQTINNPGTGPALTIRQGAPPNDPNNPLSPPPPGPAISIFGYDGSQTNIGTDGSISQLNNPRGAVPGIGTPTPTPVGGGGGGLIGQIVSGSGANYTVAILSGPQVAAVHPQIDPSEQIPAGRFVAVFKAGTAYYILEPTWL